MAHDHATVAEEEYLQTIFWLQEAGLPMTGANVARAMQLSAPTVHEMIGRLERDGYVTRGADKALAFTDERARARRGRRPPPPADRALPDRRPRHPVGRGPRGGRAARARDVARARGAHARRDRRREDLPARAPDQRRGARSTACRWPTSSRAPRSRILRFENEAEDLLHLPQGRRASSPAWRGAGRDDDDAVVVDFGGGARASHPLGGRDGLGRRRPLAAAAHGAARAARALQGPLRALRSPARVGGQLAVRAERDESRQALHGVVDVDVPV